jgi:hypothetical protein
MSKRQRAVLASLALVALLQGLGLAAQLARHADLTRVLDAGTGLGYELGELPVGAVNLSTGEVTRTTLGGTADGGAAVFLFRTDCAASKNYSTQWGEGRSVVTPQGSVPVVWLSLRNEPEAARTFMRDRGLEGTLLVLTDAKDLMRAQQMFVPQVWLMTSTGEVVGGMSPDLTQHDARLENGIPVIEASICDGCLDQLGHG